MPFQCGAHSKLQGIYGCHTLLAPAIKYAWQWHTMIDPAQQQ